MAGRDIFQGGPCKVNDGIQQGQVNQNPFNKFMNMMVQGGGQNKQMVAGFQENQQGDLVEQQMQQRQQQMMMMDKEWQGLEKDFKQKAVIDQQMGKVMEQQYQQEAMAHQHMMHMQQQQMQQAYMQEQMNQQANNWAMEHQMDQAYDKAQQEVQQGQLGRDEEQERINSAANQLFDQMAQDEDPRFKNSKFLGFLGQLKSGEVKIQGKEIIKNPQAEAKTLENAWEESKEQVQKDNLQAMNTAWDQGQQQQSQENDKLEEFWAKRIQEYEQQTADDQKFSEDLEKQYQDVLNQMNKEGGNENWEDMMQDAFTKAQDMEEHSLYKDASDKYVFKANNPYMQHENPFALGLELLSQGKSVDAILAFEASIQKEPSNKQNGNTWRIMGRLLQDNDQDQEAVACFLNCLKFDETNSDTLLALGISCTNILDEVKAMNFLKIWIQNNQLYKQIPIDPSLIPNENIHTFSVDEIKGINQRMIGLFEQARNINPKDSELLQSLAVLHFIARDYDRAVLYFQEALTFDQDNYSLWNKLGATLAHLGRAEEAMDAYHRALDIKPNYVRCWVNLGIAYAYKSDYQEAARFYLNALSFNPEANHIWSYLQTTFMCLQRFDLVSKIADKNVQAFQDEFEILSINELPEPEIAYGATTANVVLKRDQSLNQQANQFSQEMNQQYTNQANDWAKEMQQQQ